MARIAERFGVLPSQVLADIENDPNGTTLACEELLSYAYVHQEYHSGDRERMARAGKSGYFRAVQFADLVRQVGEDRALEALKDEEAKHRD